MPENNLDQILNNTFYHAKKLARDFYFKEWVKNPPKCPAFDGEVVYITREGWEHTIKIIRRTKMDVLGRLFVLERAKKLLEISTGFQNYETKVINEQTHRYWIFEAIIENVSIKIVVRSIESKPKHFLSVVRKGSIEKEIENVD